MCARRIVFVTYKHFTIKRLVMLILHEGEVAGQTSDNPAKKKRERKKTWLTNIHPHPPNSPKKKIDTQSDIHMIDASPYLDLYKH